MIEYTVKVYEDGTIEYFKSGKLHREDGPAVEYANGDKFWYLNGKRHREDGPAIECANGDKWWYLNGKRHREDGPAIERTDGSKAWWLNGERYSEEEWRKEIQKRNRAIELTVGDIEKLLGKKVKIVKEN